MRSTRKAGRSSRVVKTSSARAPTGKSPKRFPVFTMARRNSVPGLVAREEMPQNQHHAGRAPHPRSTDQERPRRAADHRRAERDLWCRASKREARVSCRGHGQGHSQHASAARCVPPRAPRGHLYRDREPDRRWSRPQLDYKLSDFNIARGSWAAQVIEAIAPKGDEIVLPKTSSSAFTSTILDYLLRNIGIEDVFVAGFTTDQCIDHAVKDGADRGYYMTCVHDACAAETEAL